MPIDNTAVRITATAVRDPREEGVTRAIRTGSARITTTVIRAHRMVRDKPRVTAKPTAITPSNLSMVKGKGGTIHPRSRDLMGYRRDPPQVMMMIATLR